MNQQQDEYYLRRAIELGRRGMKRNLGGPFGCLIVRNGLIIGEGVNQVTTANDPTAHAEVVAIRAACRKLGAFQLPDCVIYASCEPCPMCLGAIYWARPERLVFAAGRRDAAAAGFDDELIYRELALAPEDRRLFTRQLLAGEGARLLEEWKDKPDKIKY